jgi:hypothetical protein
MRNKSRTSFTMCRDERLNDWNNVCIPMSLSEGHQGFMGDAGLTTG